MAKVLVFDTETTSIDKPFCYNLAWVVADIDEEGVYTILDEKEYMVKQVWYNTMLFSTAYYADKKELYHDRIRQHFIEVKRFDEVINELSKVIEYYNIECAYAYNSQFDERVFAFMTDWFHTPNPMAEIPVFDIRAYFTHAIKDDTTFKEYCENNALFTESGNYSTTAEIAYRYLLAEDDFVEEHTALADSIIELDILARCAEIGEEIFTHKKAIKSIPREVEKVFTIQYKNKNYSFKGLTAKWYKKNNKLIIK